MSIIATLTTSLTLSDGGSSWAKAPVITANTGTSETYTQPLSVGTSPVSVTLPLAAVKVVQIRNLAPIGISAPVAAPILSQAAGGALAATTYYVKITYVNLMGETIASIESSLAVLINSVLVVAAPPALGSAIGWNVYVSNTGGGGSGTETKQNGSTPIAIGTAWNEPTSGLVAGSALPGANTTAAVVTVTWTKQGGASLTVIDLWPGAQIAFGEPTSTGGFDAPSGIGGVTAISLQSSIAATPVEVVVAG